MSRLFVRNVDYNCKKYDPWINFFVITFLLFLGAEYQLSVFFLWCFTWVFSVCFHCCIVRLCDGPWRGWASTSAMRFRWWGLAILDSWWWPLIIAVCFWFSMISGQCSMLWIDCMAGIFWVSPSMAMQRVFWHLLELNCLFCLWIFFLMGLCVYVACWWTFVVYVSM